MSDPIRGGTPISVAHTLEWPRDKPHWLEEALADQGFSVTRFSGKWGRRTGVLRSARLHVAALWQGSRAAWHADRHDGAVVAGGHHMAGVYAAVVPPTRGVRRRPVLYLNLILFDRPSLKTSLRKSLCRLALRNPRTIFTVSSTSLCRHYAELLRTDPERFLVLPDCYAPAHRSFAQHDPEHDGGYVFVGGEAARDWETALAVAKACPEIPFLFVARKRSWPQLATPANVELRFDLPLSDFWEAARNARLALVPLTSDVVTAGLIVVTHAALMGTLVIASRTAATEGYFPPEGAELLVPMFDAARAVELVQRYWSDAEARRSAAEHLQRHVVEFHSPEAFGAVVATMIRRLQKPGAATPPLDGSRRRFGASPQNAPRPRKDEAA
ncbi:MAG: glycosyltransferase family protein [Thermoleophilia bacterium]